MSSAILPIEPDLSALAAEINAAHRAAQEYASKAVERALQAGDLLIEAKSRLAHGEFGPWCKRHCPDISIRTIQNYMRVARELPVEKRTDAHLGLNEALRTLRRLDEPTDEEQADRFDRMTKAAEQARHEKMVKRLGSVPFESKVFDVADHLSDKGHLADMERCVEHLDTLSKPELEKLGDFLKRQQSEKAARIDAVIQRIDTLTQPVEKDITPTLPALPSPRPATPAINKQKPSFILLDDWLKLPDSERAGALLPGDPGGAFNRQENDSIEWAQWTWNPVTGCRAECPFCYARDIAHRFFEAKFDPAFYPSRLLAPARTKVPDIANNEIAYRNVFTCSMADLFGRWVPSEWIEAVLQQVRDNPQWNFLFLTKYPKRLAEFTFPNNAWLGATVDCQARVKATEDAFEKIDGGTRWLSIEPLLQPLKFTRLNLFDWLVIGGASASTQPPATPEWRPPFEWIIDLHQQAHRAGCRVYHKANMYERVKDFPWTEPTRKPLPEPFHYLPSLPNSPALPSATQTIEEDITPATSKSIEEIVGEDYYVVSRSLDSAKYGLTSLARHICHVLGDNQWHEPIWRVRVLHDGKIVELDKFEDYLLKPVRDGFGLSSLYAIDAAMKGVGREGELALDAIRKEIPDWNDRVNKQNPNKPSIDDLLAVWNNASDDIRYEFTQTAHIESFIILHKMKLEEEFFHN